jgi:hypothetical protein
MGVGAGARPFGTGAHEIVGNRFFPPQLVADDPGVNDEWSVPTASIFKNDDDPSVKQLDLSFELLEVHHRRVRARRPADLDPPLRAPNFNRSQVQP